MEALQRLTRRELDALRTVARGPGGATGVPLKEVARQLRIRPPTALTYLSTLEELGLVVRRRGKSRLTRAGQGCVEEYVRHHRVAESLFSGAGLSPEETCAAAREVDLVLSHRTVDQVWAAQGEPAACPHGQPIARAHAREPRAPDDRASARRR